MRTGQTHKVPVPCGSYRRVAGKHDAKGGGQGGGKARGLGHGAAAVRGERLVEVMVGGTVNRSCGAVELLAADS